MGRSKKIARAAHRVPPSAQKQPTIGGSAANAKGDRSGTERPAPSTQGPADFNTVDPQARVLKSND